jgi:hypothetical protein
MGTGMAAVVVAVGCERSVGRGGSDSRLNFFLKCERGTVWCAGREGVEASTKS